MIVALTQRGELSNKYSVIISGHLARAVEELARKRAIPVDQVLVEMTSQAIADEMRLHDIEVG